MEVEQSTPGGASPAASGLQFEIACGEQRATIVELGGALRTYTVGSRPRIDGYAREEMCSGSRGQVLMPWPNRLEDGRYEFGGRRHQLALSEPATGNAIHGLVRYANWAAVAHGDDHVTMALTLYPQPGYPFLLGLELEYRIAETGLSVHSTATNLGTEPCPYGEGFHPYLRLDPPRIDSLELRSPAGTYYPSDDRKLPTGRAPVAGTPLDFRTPRRIDATQMDTAFTDIERDADGHAAVTLSDPETGATVELWFDTSYEYLMVFTGDALPDADRRRTGLAVEPMTCAPNAFRTGDGLRVLDPGTRATGTWGIRATG